MKTSAEDLSRELNYINRVLHEFTKEDDRAAVILMAAEQDRILAGLLKAYFLPPVAKNCPLLDLGGPLEAFSSRIEVAYRIGLLPPGFHHDLQIIRKIRNEFAHKPSGLTFKDEKVGKLADTLLIGKDWAMRMISDKTPPKVRENLLSGRNLFSCSSTVIIGQLCLLQFQVRCAQPIWPNFFSGPSQSGINGDGI